MIVVVFKYLTPKGFSGFSFFPFVFLASAADKGNEVLLNHERIHLRQQLELLVLPFYVWYLIEYLFRLVQSCDRKKAYHNISFEREAYANEKDPAYLKGKPFWKFLCYL